MKTVPLNLFPLVEQKCYLKKRNDQLEEYSISFILYILIVVGFVIIDVCDAPLPNTNGYAGVVFSVVVRCCVVIIG